VAGEKFLVRFPDGFEGTFERAQFDVLKHFKDRLGAPVSDPARAQTTDRAGPEIGAPSFNGSAATVRTW
jgi:hypothetical protein